MTECNVNCSHLDFSIGAVNIVMDNLQSYLPLDALKYVIIHTMLVSAVIASFLHAVPLPFSQLLVLYQRSWLQEVLQ